MLDTFVVCCRALSCMHAKTNSMPCLSRRGNSNKLPRMGGKGRTRPTVDTQAFVSTSPAFADTKTRLEV